MNKQVTQPASTARRQSGRPAGNRSRKEEVLEAALQVFAAKGYRAATLDDIARELGFTPAALYYYVDSKQELLTTLVFRPVELLLEAIQEIEQTDQSPAAQLQEAIAAHLRIITEQREWFMVMLREQMELPEDRSAEMREKNRQYHHAIQRIIERGVRNGELATDSPRLVSLFLIGAINWTLQWYRVDGPLSADDIAAVFSDTTMAGLLPRP